MAPTLFSWWSLLRRCRHHIMARLVTSSASCAPMRQTSGQNLKESVQDYQPTARMRWLKLTTWRWTVRSRASSKHDILVCPWRSSQSGRECLYSISGRQKSIGIMMSVAGASREAGKMENYTMLNICLCCMEWTKAFRIWCLSELFFKDYSSISSNFFVLLSLRIPFSHQIAQILSDHFLHSILEYFS